MRTSLTAGWLALALSLLIARAGDAPKSGAVAATLLARGQYLVEAVSVCGDCHTARDWKGRPDREHWLQGAKLDFKPARSMPWAETAPAIAGLPGFATAAQAVGYFETGTNGGGKQSLPPMPQFRFNPDDATAVVAYLRSLAPARKD